MQVVKQYVCGPNAEGQPGCGHAFTSFTIMGLTATQRGLLRCNVCDFGIVEPKIDGKSAASWRLDRDIARSQRKVLKEVLQPLQEMVARLEAVDPPDFGSFTDWVTARASSTAGPGAGGGALPLHHSRCCAALWVPARCLCLHCSLPGARLGVVAHVSAALPVSWHARGPL